MPNLSCRNTLQEFYFGFRERISNRIVSRTDSKNFRFTHHFDIENCYDKTIYFFVPKISIDKLIRDFEKIFNLFVKEHWTNIVKSITITGHLSRNRTETDSLIEERIFFHGRQPFGFSAGTGCIRERFSLRNEEVFANWTVFL